MIESAGPSFTIRVYGRSVHVEGELDELNISTFEEALENALDTMNRDRANLVRLDLSQVDVEGGVAMVLMVNLLRSVSDECQSIVLVGPPQILAHNLYRAGLLDEPRRIQLIDVRFDEAGE